MNAKVRFAKRASVDWARRLLTIALSVTVIAIAIGALASSALAVSAGPKWTVTAVSSPTNFAPGDVSGDDVYKVTVMNTGGAASNGSPVTVTDTLPEGLTLDRSGISAFDEVVGEPRDQLGTALSCEGAVCTYSGVVAPEEVLTLSIPVDVELPDGSAVTNLIGVSGGGAPDAFMRTPTTISSRPALFGIAPGSVTNTLSSNQAGAHADLTTTLGFNTVNDKGSLSGAPKEVVDELPPGFAGDLVDTPTCPVDLFAVQRCPIDTQVGVTTVTLTHNQHGTEPVYNITPDPGYAAKLGFRAIVFNVEADVTVRPGDYGLRTAFQNIPQAVEELNNTSLTLWGVPADAIHNPWRWNQSADGGLGEYGVASADGSTVPYFTAPTSCSGEPLTAVLSSRSWEEPDEEVPAASASFGLLSGCDRLALPSTFTAQPTTTHADAPTGLNVELGVQQTYESPEGLATSTLNKAVVTLPEGITVNPSAGAGLGACTPAEFAEGAVEVASDKGCPSNSKLGAVSIRSPSLKEEATGSVYIAQPYNNPFDSLLALYVVARIPNRGVIVKAAGQVNADPLTGQLVTTFDDLPPLPFTTFTFNFHQGETSPLVSPPGCGSYDTQAQLTPWSDLSEVLGDLSPPFEITSGFEGGACPGGGVQSFAPEVTAGTLNNNASSYSPLDIDITRNDGEQEITGFSSQLPPGLTANLSGVPFCSEADIAAARAKTGAQEEIEPSCPVASQIGHTMVGAGVGSVLAYAPGKIYMAGPFERAPFSIVSITSAKVGPFDLGTVVVHLPLQLSPQTAAVSVAAGGADQIPHIIDGIVIHVRDIHVYVDKPDFTLNPTSCSPMGITATIDGSGASFSSPADDVPVTVKDAFQAANCRNLAFKPLFKASTSGKISRAAGASLSVKLTYPSASLGTQANIAKVKVDLPKQLPSRLTTLQKACTSAQFNLNPAGCPVASVVGHAKAITPILPVPLEGPAYFVSHGGEAFPSLIVVLQGYGVTIDLIGSTFISKAGITSSTFKAVPDQPIGSFELTLPQGKYSALAANESLCASRLVMPTAFVAQNGSEIHESTSISVAGCAKTKTLTRAQKLAKGLKICREKAEGKRSSCEIKTRKQYGPVKQKKK